MKCAATTLSSKLVNTERDYFAEMCVDAIDYLDAGETSLKNVGIKKVHGGALQVRGRCLVGGRAPITIHFFVILSTFACLGGQV